MSENQELPSDSDSSDEDYIPSGVPNDLSEEESASRSSADEKDSGKEDVGKTKKRTKKRRQKKKKKQKVEEKENESEKEEEQPEKTVEELKKRADNLWDDFIKDCGPVGKKKEPSVNDRVTAVVAEKENSETEELPVAKIKVTQVFDFAGENVEVEKEVDATIQAQQPSTRGRGRGRGRGGGIASILGQLGKKKMSVLDKSKLDWDRFKKDEGIDEDLELHNKGKNGYLEKQDFLQRTDLRQFEIEKNIRNTKRSLNR